MKKIIIAILASAFFATSACAQSKTRKAKPAPAGTTTRQAISTNTSTSTGTTSSVSDAANTDNVRSTTGTSPDPYRNAKSEGITPADHSYQPAGTERSGFFGNGTGGNSIGSSDSHDAGTGGNITPSGTDNKAKQK